MLNFKIWYKNRIYSWKRIYSNSRCNFGEDRNLFIPPFVLATRWQNYFRRLLFCRAPYAVYSWAWYDGEGSFMLLLPCSVAWHSVLWIIHSCCSFCRCSLLSHRWFKLSTSGQSCSSAAGSNLSQSRITLETHQTFELLSQNFPYPIHFLADRCVCLSSSVQNLFLK